MSIIRAPRPEGNFYLLDKKISEDGRLSWAARGMLIFLLGKPDHWEVSVTHLRGATAKSAKPTGRDGIYGLLDELITTGYIKRVQPRSEGGVLSKVTYLVSENPCPDSPLPAPPDTAQPLPANPTLVSIDVQQELNGAARTEKPSSEKSDASEDGFEQFWKLYPKKAKRKDALRAWQKLKPSAELQEVLITALGKHCVSHDWTKEGGRYVPLPASWINGERWEDELPAGGAKPSRPSAYVGLPTHTPEMYQDQEAGNGAQF